MIPKCIAGALIALSAAAAAAAPIVVDLDATVNLGRMDLAPLVRVDLEAGDYTVTHFRGRFTAWRFGGNPLDCDVNGENCGDGYVAEYRILSDVFDPVAGRYEEFAGFFQPTNYESAERALAEALARPPVRFELAAAQSLYFGLTDRLTSARDNSGGVSLRIERATAPVPLPPTLALMLLSLGALVRLRR